MRAPPAGLPRLSAAIIVSDRASSQLTNMSTDRCCRTWNLPIGTPNCLRVCKYSKVVSRKHVHGAHRLGAYRGRSRVIGHSSSMAESIAVARRRRASRRHRPIRDWRLDLGSAKAVDRAIGAECYAVGVGRHDKQRDALAVACFVRSVRAETTNWSEAGRIERHGFGAGNFVAARRLFRPCVSTCSSVKRAAAFDVGEGIVSVWPLIRSASSVLSLLGRPGLVRSF